MSKYSEEFEEIWVTCRFPENYKASSYQFWLLSRRVLTNEMHNLMVSRKVRGKSTYGEAIEDIAKYITSSLK